MDSKTAEKLVRKWAARKEVKRVQIPYSHEAWSYVERHPLPAGLYRLDGLKVYLAVEAEDLDHAGRLAMEFLRDVYGSDFIVDGYVTSEPFDRFLIIPRPGGDDGDIWMEQD